ncbi:hypothetical protein [Streptomyces sp. NPDC046909]|uniref:hypothetical protein n=1 Tax=Streptomyces sp. NPDC046909 TaxID=3155617 RepID=UPI0033D10FEB
MSLPDENSPCHVIGAPTPYAVLEPLLLPEPGRPPEVCRRAPECRRPAEGDLRLLRQAAMGIPPGLLRAPDRPGDRARYRWILGHHAAIALWQRLRATLEAAARAPEPAEDLIGAAARLYDVYSVLFLYAGSCTAERYAATVRAEMTDRHPAFSGEWARDYEAIPGLVRRVLERHPRELTAPLAEAARLNHRVHMAVAEKLVPGGVSLLQEHGRRPGEGPTEEERDLYDAYFVVRRRPVCEPAYDAQLVRRLTQVLCDLAAHGLSEDRRMRVVRVVADRAVPLLRGLAEDVAAGERCPGSRLHPASSAT